MMPVAVDAATIRPLPVTSDAVIRGPETSGTPVDTFERLPSSPANLSIAPKERIALQQEDLLGFWSARIGKDPIAKLGVAFWGKSRDLQDAMNRTDIELWKPELNLFTRLYLQWTAPSHVTVPPETKDELLSYWKYMGTLAETRLKDTIALKLKTDNEPVTSETIDSLYRETGLMLAAAHARAVDQDVRDNRGNVPGLLSPTQVSAYHQEVFQALGLPASTYGGTPYSLVPDVLELGLTSGLYAKGSDV